MPRLVSFVPLAAAVLITGCASVPMASMDKDSQAKQFAPARDRATLYVYRNESMGAVAPMTISINGKIVGQTAARTYFWLHLFPGRYNIESTAENVSNLPLVVNAGKNYFVWEEVKMGMWMPRSQLQQTDESAGRAGVMESQLISSTVAESDLTPLDAPIQMQANPSQPSNETLAQKLKDLQNARKEGLITENEYAMKKQQLMDKF